MNQNHKHNNSIGCTVSECKYHCEDDDYCTLDQIHVEKHSSVADTPEGTDCGSFQKS